MTAIAVVVVERMNVAARDNYDCVGAVAIFFKGLKYFDKT